MGTTIELLGADWPFEFLNCKAPVGGIT